MRFQLLSIAAAAVLLLAACESKPEESGATTGGGASTVSSTTTSTIAGPAAGSQEDLVATVGDRVFFAFDQSDISPEAQTTIEGLAAWMKANPSVVITVEGHTDDRGTREYNLALGERRANSVRDYLMALGIQGTRVGTISYGEERPAVLGSNEQAWAQNRRAVFVVR
jgi:peptidoglycan-associated lipoprotein